MPALLRCLFPRNMGSGSHWLGWRYDGGRSDEHVWIRHEGRCTFHHFVGYCWVSSLRLLLPQKVPRKNSLTPSPVTWARWVMLRSGEWQVLVGNKWNSLCCHGRRCGSQGREHVFVVLLWMMVHGMLAYFDPSTILSLAIILKCCDFGCHGFFETSQLFRPHMLPFPQQKGRKSASAHFPDRLLRGRSASCDFSSRHARAKHEAG